LLDIKTTKLINKLKRKDPEVAADISESDHETREFENALSEITSEADTGIGTLITDESLGKRKSHFRVLRRREIMLKRKPLPVNS